MPSSIYVCIFHLHVENILKGSERVLKSFSDRNNLLEPLVFRFTNSLTHGLKKSRKLRILISWVLD